MRSFFALAALAGVSQAQWWQSQQQQPVNRYPQQQQSRYPYQQPAPAPAPAPKPVEHSHAEYIIHAKPWEQCDKDVDKLQDDLETVTRQCKDGYPGITASIVKYSNLISQAAETQLIATANSQAVDNIATENGTQTGDIADLQSELPLSDDSLKEAALLSAMVEFEISQAEGLDLMAVMMRLMDIKAMQDTLMTSYENNADAAETIMTDLNIALTAVGDNEVLATGVTDSVSALATSAAAEMTAANLMINDDILENFRTQQILSDQFVQSDAMGSMIFDTTNACFSITGESNAETMTTDGAKFEFFFSGVFENSGFMGTEAQVWQINLVDAADSTIVAQAYYPNEDDTIFNQAIGKRNFFIFYKGSVAAGETLNLRLDFVGENLNFIGPSGYWQTGIRVYNEDYPLALSTDMGVAPQC